MADGTDRFEALPAPLGRGALQEIQERLLQALSTGDARQRAAAWLLRQPDADPAAQAAWAAGLRAEALAGGDALALRWADAACSGLDDEPACQRELARARARVEPENGLHWLDLARLAQTAPERDAAWQGLLRARRWQEHPAGLTALTQAALASMQPTVPGYLRARIARDTQGRDSGRPPADFEGLHEACMPDGPLRAACERLARQILETGDSAALLQQAATLGARLGWPDEHLQALAVATQAFHAGLPRWAEGSAQPMACAAVEPQLAHAEAVARQGELPPAPRR